VRKSLSLLLLVMLAVRSLLPAGFMLQTSASGDGSLEIVICTGHGPQKITLDADGKPTPPQPAKSDTGLCPYAGSAPVALGIDLPAPTASPAVATAVAFARHAELFRANRLSGAASARGPPSFQS
jgi:hypothetical protein